ncbi:hypothetical protein ACVWWL_004885 [Bradyrhizobium sp. USDA 3696]
MRIAPIRMRLLDDGAGFGKAFRRFPRDRFDFGIDRCDAEIRRIGDALRFAA